MCLCESTDCNREIKSPGICLGHACIEIDKILKRVSMTTQNDRGLYEVYALQNIFKALREFIDNAEMLAGNTSGKIIDCINSLELALAVCKKSLCNAEKKLQDIADKIINPHK